MSKFEEGSKANGQDSASGRIPVGFFVLGTTDMHAPKPCLDEYSNISQVRVFLCHFYARHVGIFSRAGATTRPLELRRKLP
jgi:hypothetical protein